MSKMEIIAALSKLSPADLAEVQAKLDELAGDAWQRGSEQRKQMLRASQGLQYVRFAQRGEAPAPV